MKKAIILLIVITAGSFYYSCQKKVVPASDTLVKLKSYDTATFDYIYVEAIKQKLLGNNGEALRYFEHCLKINPQSDAVYFQMAQIILALGDENSGKKYALKAYEIRPDNLWYQMMLAGTYYKENNLDSAIIFYEKVVKKYPEKEGLIMSLGNIYSENMKYDKAAEIFQALDKKYGVNKTSTAAEIQNLIRAGKFEQAEIKANELIKQYPDEIMFNALLAEIYRGKGENDKALEVYRKLIDRNPNNPEIQLSLCDFLINEKKYEDLSELLGTVVLNDKILKEDKIGLFARLIELQDFIKAYGERLEVSLMVFEAAYKDDDVIILLRPELFSEEGKNSLAIERYETIIKEKPGLYYAWEKLLLLYFQEGNYKKLEERGEECATNFNRSFLAKILYATALSENKHYESAIEELRKAEILAGDNNDMLLQVLSIRADVYYRMKDYDKAFSTFDEALKKNKDDISLLNNYAYYLAEQNQRLKEAEQMAEKVIEKEGKNPTYLDTYAWVLYKRGKYNDALKVMESIMESNSKPDAEYYEHFGYILKKKRKCSEAVKSWERAVNIDSTKTYLNEEIKKCEGEH